MNTTEPKAPTPAEIVDKMTKEEILAKILAHELREQILLHVLDCSKEVAKEIIRRYSK